MTRARATMRCTVCKRPSTTQTHPSCARRAVTRSTYYASPAVRRRRAVASALAHPKRAARRQRRKLAARARRSVRPRMVTGPASARRVTFTRQGIDLRVGTVRRATQKKPTR